MIPLLSSRYQEFLIVKGTELLSSHRCGKHQMNIELRGCMASFTECVFRAKPTIDSEIIRSHFPGIFQVSGFFSETAVSVFNQKSRQATCCRFAYCQGDTYSLRLLSR